jgi:hypothetical protein
MLDSYRCPEGKKMKLFCVFLMLLLLLVPAYSQTTWVQKLDGWIDGTYRPYLFSGGSFYTKVSFVDIDGDGDYDMFYGGGNTGSFRLFENIGTRYSPSFRLKDLVHPGLVASGRTTLDADFADLDGDGDFDAMIMAGNTWGATGRFENIGTRFVPQWRYPPYGQQRSIGGWGPPTLVDFDEDGDYDLINGEYRDSIFYFQRVEEPIPLYYSLVTHRLGNIFIGSTFNMDVKDLDADGDYDIVACVTGGVNKYIEDIGGPGLDSLHWVIGDSNFLGGQYTPDWLECPELVDIDGDGDLDLFLAGAFAHLNYFENIGTPQIPQFIHRYDTTLIYNLPVNVERATVVDFNNDGLMDIVSDTLLLLNVGQAREPLWQAVFNFIPNSYKKAFCDIDADGDQDILIPWSGGVVLMTNTGTAQQPLWDQGHYLISDAHSYGLYSVVPVDIDADNDYDIIAFGESSRDFLFYRNVGDSANPSFEFVTSHYLGLNTTFGQDPTFIDIDHDGDKDLLISNFWNYDLRSKLFYYENIGTPQEAVWDSVTDDYMGWFSSGLVGHAYVGGGDYDADGDDDILLSHGLGLILLENPTITGIEEDLTLGGNSLPIQHITAKTYPNPFNSVAAFNISGQIARSLTIDIYNILGQRIDAIQSKAGQQRIEWRSGNNPSGLYFYSARNGQNSTKGKFVLIK